MTAPSTAGAAQESTFPLSSAVFSSRLPLYLLSSLLSLSVSFFFSPFLLFPTQLLLKGGEGEYVGTRRFTCGREHRSQKQTVRLCKPAPAPFSRSTLLVFLSDSALLFPLLPLDGPFLRTKRAETRALTYLRAHRAPTTFRSTLAPLRHLQT